MGLSVDHGDRTVVFQRDIRARVVGQETDRPWARADRNTFQHFIGGGVDREHRAVFLAGHVNHFAIRADRHAFRLVADLHRRHDVPRRDVDDADLAGVFVGDVHPRPIGADRQLFGIVACLDHPRHLVGFCVDFADAIGAPVGRRQRFFVHSWRCARRAAERDVEELAAGPGLNASGTLAERRSRDHRVGCRIDDRQIARRFVRHEHPHGRNRWGGRRCACARRCWWRGGCGRRRFAVTRQ